MVNVDLRLSDEANREIEVMAYRLNISKEAALLRVLGLAPVINRAALEGNQLALINRQGKLIATINNI